MKLTVSLHLIVSLALVTGLFAGASLHAADVSLVSRDVSGNVGAGNSGFIAFQACASPVADDGSVLLLSSAKLDPAKDTNIVADVYRSSPAGAVALIDLALPSLPRDCHFVGLNAAGDQCYLLRQLANDPRQVKTLLGAVALVDKTSKGVLSGFVAADWAGEAPFAALEQEEAGVSRILRQSLAADPATLVPIASDPAFGCFAPAISSDGNRVAFVSRSSTFVPPGTGFMDAFVFAANTGTYQLLSPRPFWTGTRTAPDVQTPDISGDGSVVCFAAGDGGFLADDTNGFVDIFAVAGGVIERCSLAQNGSQGNADATGPRLNGNGRFVLFLSRATNLVPGVNNGQQQVYLFDRESRVIEALSANAQGAESDRDCLAPAISPSGRYVTFFSQATNLASGTSGLYNQVYRVDRGPAYANHPPVASLTYVSGAAGQVLEFSPSASDADGDALSFSPLALPTPARGVVSSAQGEPLVVGQWYGPATLPWRFEPAGSGPRTAQLTFVASDGKAQSGAEEVILKLIDSSVGAIIRASLTSAGGQAVASSYLPFGGLGLSADGRQVAFPSQAALAAEDTDGRTDVYLRDWIGESTSLASPDVATGNAFRCVLSGDGQWLVYYTSQGNRLLLANRATGQEREVATLSGIPDFTPGISHDGQRVVYAKQGAIYAFDRLSALTQVVSLTDAGDPANGTCSEPAISADGQVVAFVSVATNLSPANPTGAQAVYARFLAVGKTALISADGSSGLLLLARQPSLSRSGAFAVVAVGDPSSAVYVVVPGGGAPRLVDADASNPVISASGRFVTVLKAGQIHRVDLGTAEDALVSNRLGAPGDGDSLYAVPSLTGQFVAFASDASDLVADDTNGVTDVFVTDLAPPLNQVPAPTLTAVDLLDGATLSHVALTCTDPNHDDVVATIGDSPQHAAEFHLDSPQPGLAGFGFTYTPIAGFRGVDRFTYRVADVFGSSAPQEVVVTVRNRPPIASPGSASGSEDDVILTDLRALVVDTDPPEALSFSVKPPAQGSAVVTAAGVLRYTPAWDALRPGDVREIVLEYTVSDGESTAESTVTVTVTGRNDPPAIQIRAYPRLATDETVVQIGLAGGRGPAILALTDPDSDANLLRLIVSRLPAKGQLRKANGEPVIVGVPLADADLPLTYETTLGQEDTDPIGFMATDGLDVSAAQDVPVLFQRMNATVVLYNGWNAVSLPLVPSSTVLTVLLAHPSTGQPAYVPPAFAWDAGRGCYVPTNEWAPGKGFFVFAAGLPAGGVAIPVSGETATTSLLDVVADWNLLGPLGHGVQGPLPPQPDGTAFQAGQVWHFAGTGVLKSTRLLRGSAQWFLVTEPGKLDLNLERDTAP